MSEGNIFISYRREDSAGYTRAVFDQLVKRFSKQRVFMDVDAIDPGLAFDQVIEQAVGNCEVLLVMIGKRWIEPQPDGGLRIQSPDDFVRLEISAALARDVRVIPVLLDGASMPAENQLPEQLRPLARRNAIELSNSRFDSDIDKLVEAIGKVVGDPLPRDPHRPLQRRPLLLAALGTSAAAIGAPTIWWFVSQRKSSAGGPVQSQARWRYCNKCQSLFFNGYASKGVCAGGGGHSAEGYDFVLRYGAAAGPGQRDWRFCEKCGSMFFDGYPSKGVCPAGDAHRAEGFNFVLDHDGAGVGQSNWRYCRKCQAMFFDGYPRKGVCPARDAHSAEGFNFVLPHA